MERPRRCTYPLSTYLNDNKEGDISNDVDTQRKPAWKPIVNGLIVTVLTDDYIPPIILGEDEDERKHILDGGSRTAALMMFKYGNHKISSSLEDSVVSYKEETEDEDGHTVSRDVEFNLRNKTYEQLPKKLKKRFDNYQLETVIYSNCTKEMETKYIKRFNIHSSMNTDQKGFMYIDEFADNIRKIMDSNFFVNCSVFTDNNKDKGVVERCIAESIMCMNHFDDWKTQPKALFKYLNENATEEEFEHFADNLHTLENIITEDIKSIFNKKDSFIFLTLFDKFIRLDIDNDKFADFLREFKSNLRNVRRNEKGLLFDEIDKELSTKDKQVITDKLDLLEKLMTDFLYNSVDTYNCTTTENESFVADMLDMDLDKVIEEMEVYNDDLNVLLDKRIRDDSKLLDKVNRKSLLAMVAYSYKKEENLDEWLEQYAAKNNMYFPDQRKNFLHMKKDFINYIETKEKANV